MVVALHLHQRRQVELFGEDVGLRARVRDEAGRVQLLGRGHRVLGGQAELAGAKLLQFLYEIQHALHKSFSDGFRVIGC